MERIEKIFHTCEKNINNLHKFGMLMSVRVDAPANALFAAADTIDLNPAVVEGDSVANAFLQSLPLIPYYKGFVSDSILKRDMLANMASMLSCFSFAGKNIETVFFVKMYDPEADLEAELNHLSELFLKKFGFGLRLVPGDLSHCQKILKKRAEKAQRFFVEEQGAWLGEFLSSLQDDISRISFISFLRQRIFSMVFYDNDVCIPVNPPSATRAWRRQRESEPEDLPKLFGIDGEPLNPLHLKHIYTYQQYCVPGVVEPLPGSTVVDAGAFVGDTTAWFAQKVGEKGKVHAFEPSPKNMERCMENMRINGFENVVEHNCGISDSDCFASVRINSVWGSADKVESDKNGDIKLSTLDNLLSEKVDFIKSDIEGNEMSLLRGASEIIRRDAPTCAICLYHKKDDFWQIPQYLLELRPDYKFWFRSEAEPVLFAKL